MVRISAMPVGMCTVRNSANPMTVMVDHAVSVDVPSLWKRFVVSRLSTCMKAHVVSVDGQHISPNSIRVIVLEVQAVSVDDPPLRKTDMENHAVSVDVLSAMPTGQKIDLRSSIVEVQAVSVDDPPVEATVMENHAVSVDVPK